MASQLNETTTTYRDAVKRALAPPQPIPPAMVTTATLDVRVHAREGVKKRQVLVNATEPGAQILGDLDNPGLAKKAKKALCTLDTEARHTIVSARRLNNGGVLFELDSEEAATWINEAQHQI